MSEPGPQPPRGLGRRFLMGGVYLGASNWLTYALNFAIQVLIARILGPEDFGLYAFVRAIFELLAFVGGFSLGAALLQARDESQPLYDTALAICVALGLISLLAACAISPLLWIHRSPTAAWFLLTMCFSQILSFSSQVPHARMERHLRYGPISAIGFLTGNVPNLIALGLAWGGIGPWCLVVRDALFAAMTLALELGWSGYRFRGRIERVAARELMSFAWPMFFSRGILILLQRIDSLAVGTMLGNAAIGLYQQARFLSEAGLTATRPITQLSFNLYARVRDDPRLLSRSYEIVNYFLIRLIFAGAVVLLVFPEETLRLLLGDEWLEAAPLLRWLAIYAAFMPVHMNLRQVFNAVGQVVRNVRINLLQVCVFGPAVLVASLTGNLAGVAIALTGSTLLALGVAWWYSRDLVARRPMRLLATPSFAFAISALVLWSAERVGLLAGVAWYLRPLLGPLVYGAVVLAIERRVLVSELGFLRAQLGSAGGGAPASDPD